MGPQKLPWLLQSIHELLQGRFEDAYLIREIHPIVALPNHAFKIDQPQIHTNCHVCASQHKSIKMAHLSEHSYCCFIRSELTLPSQTSSRTRRT